MTFFKYFTPITYWVLLLMWSFIFVFYIKRLRSKKINGKLIFTLLLILAIDAFRTLFESAYFGAWYTALVGFLPESVYAFLVRPEIVFIPKALNLIAAIVVICILIYRWLPQEEREKKYLENLIEQQTDTLSKNNENLNAEIAERKLIEEELRHSEEKYKGLFNSIRDAILVADTDRSIIDCNLAFADLFGYSKNEICGKKTRSIYENEAHFKELGEALKEHYGDTPFLKTVNYKKKNGDIFPGETGVYFLKNYDKEVIGFIGLIRDITERKAMELRVQQSQKMEAIGTLAGGIAHDFNNILSPIIGYTEMILDDLPEESALKESLNEVYSASMRAKDLVKQILAFSRKECEEQQLIAIQPVLKEALKLIRATIPTTIQIKQNISDECGFIKADPTQIHQIIMNLTTNSYHAMEKTGGTLNVTLDEIELKDENLPGFHITPGRYACLTVADTGTGIHKKIKSKIFEPYFTTKEKNKGTGLGLSVVYGIVRQSGGGIQLSSEPGKGTEFQVYLPIAESDSKKEASQDKKMIQGGLERILLVDDEEPIVKMERKILERLGYQVTSCTSSIEALEAFRGNPNRFDLVITDFSMPNMAGDELAMELGKIRSDIPIMICTGFSENMSEEKAISLGLAGFLMKPIVVSDFSQKIRNVLDGVEHSTLTHHPTAL